MSRKKRGLFQELALSMFLIFLILVFLPTFSSLAQEAPQIDEVILVSGSEVLPDDINKTVPFEEKIKIWAIIKSGQSYYLGGDDSFPEEVKIKGKLYSIKKGSLKRWPRNRWGQPEINWYQVMPKMKPSQPSTNYPWYSNVITEGEAEGQWRGFDIIEYKQIPLFRQGWCLTPAKKPGTVRFRAEVTFQGKKISSPGRPDSSQLSGLIPEDYYRGIKATVCRISRLSDHPNKLIRYLEALRGVPWCWGPDFRDPPKNTPFEHQSDFSNPVCTECSEVIIASLRAMGNKNVRYTSVENMVKGLYTRVLDERVLTYQKVNLFEDLVPRSLTFQENFYLSGGQKIQIRDNNFQTIREFGIDSLEILDLTISAEKEIYVIGRDEDKVAVYLLDSEDRVKSCIEPAVQQSIFLGKTEYFSQVKIHPSGIDVDKDYFTENERQLIYLLVSDTVYAFTQEGKEVGSISLTELSSGQVPVGTLRLYQGLIYLPVYDQEILIYNFQGKLVRTINFEEPVLALEIKEENLIIIHPFPLRAVVYDLEGHFLRDFSEKILDKEGREVRIKIGTTENELNIGDPIFKISPTFHTQLLYQDNGNNVLDGRDKIICVGHDGVEIRRMDSLKKKEFVLRKFEGMKL